MMFISIRQVLKYSVDNYLEVKRTDWAVTHPGQCVLNGSQVHWTREVEEAITGNALADYLAALQNQLLETVEKVRGK